MENSENNSASRLRQILHARDATYTELSELTGVARTTIYDFMSGSDCRISHVDTIAKSLGLELVLRKRKPTQWEET